MFRGAPPPSLVWVIVLFSLFVMGAVPLFANAQMENICAAADKMCGPHATLKTPCGCTVGTWTIVGVCGAPDKCKQTSYYSGLPTGTTIQEIAANPSAFSGSLVPEANVPFGITNGTPGLLDGVSSFMSKNPLLSGLGMGLGMSLLQSLMSGSGGSGSGNNDNSQNPSQTGVCTTQYYYTSDPNALADPCAIYNPSNTNPNPTPNPNPSACLGIAIVPICKAGETLQPQTGLDANGCALPSICVPGVGSPSPTSSCSIFTNVECPVGQVAKSPGLDTKGCALPFACVPINANPGSATLKAAPSSGTVPLSVDFTGTTGGMGGSFSVDFGDGQIQGGLQEWCTTVGTKQTCAIADSQQTDAKHEYDTSGTYTAALQQFLCTSSGAICTAGSTTTVANTTVVVSDGQTQNQNTEQPISEILNSTVYYDDTTSSSTPPPSQTPLGEHATPAPGQGLHGNLLDAGGGATVVANSVNGNTEVSGFYGGPSSAGQLCKSRPWATNFLSYIIPPSFFDNLCTWAGYPPGSVQGGGTSNAGGGTTVSVPAPKPDATLYVNTSHPAATIWAQPATVSLGGRTTIFWTSQNVSACTESSSDGNFSGSSTSGGASTVALSGPVTFTIECRTVDGTKVTNSTTVTIGS